MACSKMNTKLEKLLKCSICQDRVEKPRTLKCFHSFCKNCIKKLPRNGVQGIRCPNCHVYSTDDSITSNFLLNELLDIYGSGSKSTCEQCLKTKPSWKCLDCKIHLCLDCKQIHLRVPLLKNHKLVSHTGDCDVIVDRLVFCKLHQDEPIKFNCRQCDILLCIKCKGTKHEKHPTETTEETLDRLLPDVKAYNADITKHINALEETLVETLSVKENLKEKFSKCREKARNRLNEVLEMAKTQHSELVKQLAAEEEKETNKLDTVIDEIEHRRIEYEHANKWVNTSIEMAKGVSLVTVLQTGLIEQIKKIAMVKHDKEKKVNFPVFDDDRDAATAKVINDLIGKVRYQTKFIPAKDTKERICLPTTFTNLQLVKEVPLTAECIRMNIINDRIWCPTPSNGCIEIFDFSGEKFNSIAIVGKHPVDSPRSVTQAINGDILVASDSGLYVVDENGEVLYQVSAGKFSDVSSDGCVTVGLKYDTCEVVMFDIRNDKWRRKSAFPTGDKNHEKNSILYDKVGEFIYVSHGTFIKFDLNGIVLFKMFEDYIPPNLCMTDSKGNILIGDCEDGGLLLLNGIKVITSLPLDTVPTSCVWINDTNVWITHSNRHSNGLLHYENQ